MVLEVVHEGFAFCGGDADGEEVVDAVAVRGCGEGGDGRVGQVFQVRSGDGAAALRGGGEAWEEGRAEDGRLEFVESAIEAEEFVLVFGGLSVIAQRAAGGGEVWVAGEDGTAVAESAEVFGGVEAGGGGEAGGAAGLVVVGGSDALGAVFEDADAMLLLDGAEMVEVEAMTEEVDGEEPADVWSLCEDVAGELEVEQSGGVGIGEDGDAAGADDGEGRGESAQWGCEDVVALLQSGGAEGDFDGVHAIGGADGMRDLPCGGQFLFEAGDFPAEDVPARLADP